MVCVSESIMSFLTLKSFEEIIQQILDTERITVALVSAQSLLGLHTIESVVFRLS